MEQNNNNVAIQPQEKVTTFEVNGYKVNLTKAMVINYLTSGNGKVTEQEAAMYIGLCRANALDPFAKECFCIKFGNSPAQMVISADAIQKRAVATGLLNGIQYGVIVQRGNEAVFCNGTFLLPNDVLVGGWAKVLRKDMDIPYEISINLSEYKKDQATWKTMPATMIAKCARAKALRETFPNIAGGMISNEEISEGQNDRPFASSRAERIARASKEKTIVIPTEANDVAPEIPTDEPIAKAE